MVTALDPEVPGLSPGRGGGANIKARSTRSGYQSCRTSRQRLGVNQTVATLIRLQGRLCITNNSMVFKNVPDTCVK